MRNFDRQNSRGEYRNNYRNEGYSRNRDRNRSRERSFSRNSSSKVETGEMINPDTIQQEIEQEKQLGRIDDTSGEK